MTARQARWTVLFAGTIAWTVSGHAGLARGETCSATPVTARGEPARYDWMAKLKARANWRAKVRAMPELGTDWAAWGRAANTEERCLSGPDGTVCIFTGTPCRP